MPKWALTHKHIVKTIVDNSVMLSPMRLRSSINRAQTRSFPGADVGSDHDMIMMNFLLRLKKIRR